MPSVLYLRSLYERIVERDGLETISKKPYTLSCIIMTDDTEKKRLLISLSYKKIRHTAQSCQKLYSMNCKDMTIISEVHN